MTDKLLRVGIAQISPVWLDRIRTTEKITDYIAQAGKDKCDLVVFGEAILPGYPFWVELTNGAKFNSDIQKELFSLYLSQSIRIDRGDLDEICLSAKSCGTAVYVGTVEAATDRGGHSLYCSLVYIDKEGIIKSVHRKLMPTYEERLIWSIGDGYGLVTHSMGNFTVGGLNCWENWMPLARTSLHAMGEDLHIAVWPGSLRNTGEITRFIAMEARSFVVSVSGLMNIRDVPENIPYYDLIASNASKWLADGGSCVSGPDGKWLQEPVCEKEGLFIVNLDHGNIQRERHNLDISGHYSRPDIINIEVNRQRQKIAHFID